LQQQQQIHTFSYHPYILGGAVGKSRGNNSFKVLYEMMCIKRDNTSIKKESEEKYSWWLNELNTLGLAVKKANDLNDIREVSSLADNIKQVLFQDYKTRYNGETEDIVI
jgi:hypothetical protein